MALEAYRAGNAVDDADALEAWARAARPVLIQTARRYGALTTPPDLAESVQVLSDVRTREPAELWIDDILDAVDTECGARSEPLLSAFCVGPDGRIGARYETRVAKFAPTAVTDIEMHAAKQRLDAHAYHGAVLPVDGGRPALPRQLAEQRAAAAKRPARATTSRASATRTKVAVPRKPKKPDPPKRPVCPTCFLELPLTGRCDNCDPE
jgi:hypothetical protein